MTTKQTTKTIALIIFQQAQALDITGPVEVFAQANKFLGQKGTLNPLAYDILLIAPDDNPVAMSSGIKIMADHTVETFNASGRSIDTLIISGGNGVDAVKNDPQFINFIKCQAKKADRIASICTGTFALARTGLLDGKQATTHWASCGKLAQCHPRIAVKTDMIYIRDQNIYSSAGVTAGIDLALALVEEDFGRKIALDIAKQLVVFMKRQGGQSQFSTTLAGQHVEKCTLKQTLDWIQQNPGHDLSLETLASRSAMSQRNFARIFKKEVGMTPGKYVEKMRVEFAAQLIESSSDDLGQIAVKSGFKSDEMMRRAFKRQLNVLPHLYRKRFGQ